MEDDFDRCDDQDCMCNNPRRFYVGLDEMGNPNGEVCWAYYPDDKPVSGEWVLVEEVL